MNLVIDNGRIRLGGEELPGVEAHVEVSNKVNFKELKLNRGSGSAKIPAGYNDASARVVVQLTDDSDVGGTTPLEKLAVYEQIFKSTDDQVEPFVYRVVNDHMAARGIRQVVVEQLRSVGTNQTDVVVVELQLVEHRPLIIKKETLARARRRAQLATIQELAKRAVDEAKAAAAFAGAVAPDVVQAAIQTLGAELRTARLSYKGLVARGEARELMESWKNTPRPINIAPEKSLMAKAFDLYNTPTQDDTGVPGKNLAADLLPLQTFN